MVIKRTLFYDYRQSCHATSLIPCLLWFNLAELSEDWSSLREPVIDGVPFYVKYLGSSLVQKASGEEATAEAIKTIIAMVQ